MKCCSVVRNTSLPNPALQGHQSTTTCRQLYSVSTQKGHEGHSRCQRYVFRIVGSDVRVNRLTSYLLGISGKTASQQAMEALMDALRWLDSKCDPSGPYFLGSQVGAGTQPPPSRPVTGRLAEL